VHDCAPWHTPALHNPLAALLPEQVATQVPSAVLSCTFVQVPADPGMLHDWQVGQVADLQHTPSTQFPVVHVLAVEHVAPSPILLQTPPMQEYPPPTSHTVLSLPEVQAEAHAPFTHMYPGPHGTDVPGVQVVPDPLQSPVVATACRGSAQLD